MIKRMLIMLVLFGVVLGGLFGFKVFVNGKIKEAMAGMANTPQTVSAALLHSGVGIFSPSRRRARAASTIGVAPLCTIVAPIPGAGPAKMP